MTLQVQRELYERDAEMALIAKAEIERDMVNATFAGDLFAGRASW